jgi:TolB-like protein/DNA-binding winged helix-turn-helix (wHTH) protein/Tfp pilus assembly protein PilF
MRKTTYTIGEFSIDSDSRLLFRNEDRVPLPPKAADILIALLRRPRQLVTKDELLKEVWPDTFVEEGNLARHVFLLRKTLGEAPDGSSYVETVPKRGYRFIGPVQSDDANLVTLTAEERTSERILIEETETLDPRDQQTGRRYTAIAAAVAATAGLLALLLWTRTDRTQPIRSLVVLPFANLSISGDSEYYSDGLTDELIGAFSSVRGLRVVPRTTAFQFKGKSGDVRSIGRQLETDAVLDGDVQRDRDHLRIHVSLTRVRDGHTMWSQTYGRPTQDVFAMQEEIARNVLGAIFPNQQHRVDIPPPSGTRNLAAQNLYLKANFIRQKFMNSSLTDAIALFAKATELDPAYAQAWAGQAFCYAEIGYGYQRYPKEVFPLAIQATERALSLNPRLALAHATRGYVSLVYLRDWNTARRELETAIQVDLNDGESHHWMSHYWVSAGRFREAAEESRRALECDPLNFTIGAHQVWLELERANYAEALRAAEPTLRLDPHHGPTLFYQTRAYEESGQLREAIRGRQRLGWQVPSTAELEASVAAHGPAGYWRLVVQSIEARRRIAPASPSAIATAYAHLGDRARALDWLEQAVEEHDPWAVYIKVEPAFASLRTDPRFQKITRTAGIP